MYFRLLALATRGGFGFMTCLLINPVRHKNIGTDADVLQQNQSVVFYEVQCSPILQRLVASSYGELPAEIHTGSMGRLGSVQLLSWVRYCRLQVCMYVCVCVCVSLNQ
jgi:hypothetical protein